MPSLTARSPFATQIGNITVLQNQMAGPTRQHTSGKRKPNNNTKKTTEVQPFQKPDKE